MGFFARVRRRPAAAGSRAPWATPVAGLEIELLDDEDCEVPTGEVGEFCVRPTRAQRDLQRLLSRSRGNTARPSATSGTTRGDLGRRDEDGEYYFVDRKADFIRYKGRNISSFAVEAAVSAHPAVQECAAHGVVSAELDSEAELKVAVVRKSGQTVVSARRAGPLRERATPPTSSCPATSSSWTSSRTRRPGACRSSSCASAA